MKQQIRIIGGKYRGKKITFPLIDGLRPTPDRVRETLFNWLMHNIANARCLDAFAGSGALGLEAFSRSAAEVVLVEKSTLAYQNLQRVISEFDQTNDRLNIINADVMLYLNTKPDPFDIIFVDPPFNQIDYASFMDLININNTLKKGGVVYIESPYPVVLNDWKLLKQKRAGAVYYSLLTHAS